MNDETKSLLIETGYGENNATYIITLLEYLDTSKGVSVNVDIKFTSHLTDTLQGFYRTSYSDSQSQKK